jgi:hypothetical protein
VEHHDMTDDLQRRLRAARPLAARVDQAAFDQELLDRVRRQPVGARRAVRRSVALPVAAVATLLAAAVVMFGGVPGDVGGPSSAAALTQTLHWLNPPPGTILHVRSVETQGGDTTTRELWQSADHPESARQLVVGAQRYETAGDGLYDPATDTIYDAATPGAEKAKLPAKRPAPAGKGPNVPAGDAVVTKVRILLQAGQMQVTGHEVHNGADAWAVSLKPGFGRPVWTLWVSAADGKPLELRDPGRDASEQPQVIRWPAYEVLPASNAQGLLTLRGAHPSARVVHDPAQTAAAEQRLGVAP